ncbi:unnamed protein product [Clonostachys solani]|uniref:C2H2-type domain-containing protein n=1 Tax=Clonostachys solani TaxID=160281 RepID=A0A9P0ECH8_9HYPO|nr:unnamed protein product [Clonostachys solani]
MDPSGIEPTPSLEQEGELSSRSLSCSSLPSLFGSPIDEYFISSEGDASQTADQSVWQQQPKTYPEPQFFWPLLEDEWYIPAELPHLNEETHAWPPSQDAPNSFHNTSFPQQQLGGVYQQSSQYFVEQPLPMIPEPSPAIPPPFNAPSAVTHDMDWRADLARWYTSSQNSESAASSPIATVLGNTEHNVANSLHGQHQAAPKAGFTTSFTSGLGRLPARARGKKSATARPKRSGPKRAGNPEIDKFPCTFCCDVFTTKHDWTRHETSRHLLLGGWKCTPFGLLTASDIDGTPICSYCGFDNPTEAHFKEHESRRCNKEHVYARKDNLKGHLRAIHKVEPPPWLETWKLELPDVKSRCGFCDGQLDSWESRAEHLTGHFYDGKTMEDWEGDHDFAPEIAAQVINAIPPYIIAAESAEPAPFSATHPNRANQMTRHRSLKQKPLVWMS